MTIFELSGVDYLGKHLKLTLSRQFEIFQKNQSYAEGEGIDFFYGNRPH